MRNWGARSARAWRIAAIAGTAFAAITILHRMGALSTMDAWVEALLRSNASAALDALGRFDDLAFDPAPAFVSAVVLAAIIARVGPAWAWIAPLGIAISGFIDLVLRRGAGVILHPRELLTAMQELVGVHYHGLNPYPSGHVERAAFLAVIVLAYLPRPVAVPAAIVAATTLIGRVYSGGHHASDVLGGAALGISVGALMVWVVERAPAVLDRLGRRRKKALTEEKRANEDR